MARARGISAAQRRTLDRLTAVDALPPTYLAGGVAVAFHLEHRRSRDLDLFTSSARRLARRRRTLVSMTSDTHPDAARVQLELLRKAGTRGRLALTLRLSNAMIAASRRAIRRRHPELSEEEVRLLWAELHYGKELADRVRAHLAKHASAG